MTYYNVLLEDIYKSIVVIEQRDVYRFVTCNDNYIPHKIIQRDDSEDDIVCYDIVNKKILTIPIIEISRHYHYDINDLEENDKILLERASAISVKIDQYVEQNDEITHSEIYDSYIKPYIVDINNVNDLEILDFLSDTKFKICYDDIVAPAISEYRKDNIIQLCNALMNERVEEILTELNTLKHQTEDAEDVADIDTIIQMYTDSLTEINYHNCVSLTDYLKNWPPLLLPMPPLMDKFIHKISKIKNIDRDFIDFMSIVDNSLTYAEMQELIDELNSIQLETNAPDIDKFKEYLKYKLNNGHKQS